MMFGAEGAMRRDAMALLRPEVLRYAAYFAAVLPEALVRYLVRTDESVTLGDASKPSPFRADPCIFQYRVASILCLPVIHQAKLTGSFFWRVLNRALQLAGRAIDKGRAAIRGIHTFSPAPSTLEDSLRDLLSEVAPGRRVRLRIFVQGKPRTLTPAIQGQLFLIGQEAVMNALRHSAATKIEVEIQYLRNILRVVVCDNGCGINPEAVQKERDAHSGFRAMRNRAENIGARFEIWSKTGAGTEVCVAVPVASRTGTQ
jgi:anti-sigma regulatory factor (Ser/Thr protein kinase)